MNKQQKWSQERETGLAWSSLYFLDGVQRVSEAPLLGEQLGSGVVQKPIHLLPLQRRHTAGIRVLEMKRKNKTVV